MAVKTITQWLVCRWCPHTSVRFLDGVSTPTNPYYLLKGHIAEAHPEEHQRIEGSLTKEVIVREGG